MQSPIKTLSAGIVGFALSCFFFSIIGVSCKGRKLADLTRTQRTIRRTAVEQPQVFGPRRIRLLATFAWGLPAPRLGPRFHFLHMTGYESGVASQGMSVITLKNWTTEPQEDRPAAAEKAFEEGEQLRDQGTAESLRKAIERYQEAFQLWHGVGDDKRAAVSLNYIGFAYDSLGEKRKALDFYNQALPLFRVSGDRGGEAMVL